MKKKGGIFLSILISILILNFASAAIGNSLHLNIQTINSTGGVITGTFNFGFNISTTSDCNATNVVYANASTLTTDSRGIISYYLDNVNINFYSQYYWLCYYRNGVLINSSKIVGIPYSLASQNTTLSGVKVDSNLVMGTYNITSSWFFGLFSWLVNNDVSQNYLSFNGSTLSFNETKLNNTIDNIAAVFGNASWNQSFANTLYATIGTTSGNLSWNQSFANGLYAPNTTAGIQYLINSTGIYSQGGNASWNQSFANTLYATIGTTSGNLSWNQSFANGLYAPNTTAGIQYLINSTGIYSQGGNASWNQSFANTLYATIGTTSGNLSWNQSFANGLYAPNTTAGIQFLINGTNVNFLNVNASGETINGNLTATNFIGNGAYLTGISGGSSFPWINSTSYVQLNSSAIQALNVSNFLFVNSTNVGINVTSPIYELQLGNAGNALNVSGVLYVNSTSGFVGINQTSPSSLLDVGGSSGQIAQFGDAGGLSNQNYITIGGSAMFGYDGTTDDAAIQGISGKGIEFNVGNTTFGASSSTAMVITSGGDIGINTTSPTNELDVGGTGVSGAAIYGNGSNLPYAVGVYGRGDSNIGVEGVGSTGVWGIGSIGVQGSGTSYGVYANGAGAYDFYAANATGESYFAGKIGINVSSPISLLSINDAGNSSSSLYSYNGQTGGIGIFANSSNAGGVGIYSYGGDKGVLSYGTNYDFYGGNPSASNYFAGNVGIGSATSPVAPLDIYNGADHLALSVGLINSTRGTNGMWITSSADIKLITDQAKTGSFADVGFYYQNSTNPRIYFRTNGDSYFNTSGNVGIGTTSPISTLSVGGNGLSNAEIYGSYSSAVGGGYGVYGTSSGTGVQGITTGNTSVNFGGNFSAPNGNYAEMATGNGYGIIAKSSGSAYGVYTNSLYVTTGPSHIEGTLYVAGGYGNIQSGDVAEDLQTIAGRNAALCAGNVSCMVNDYKKEDLSYGDVVCINPNYGETIMLCNESDSELVAGVVSNTSTIDMGSNISFSYPIAVAGIVYTKVLAGSEGIKPGDLLVSSSVPGYAMKAPANWTEGTILGKAYDFCDTRYYTNCTIPMFVALE